MYTHSIANENDMEWFTPGKSCKKCDTKPFSGQCIFEGKIAIFLFVSGFYLQA
jgi:hypothetical protein